MPEPARTSEPAPLAARLAAAAEVRVHRARTKLLAKSLGTEPTAEEASRCTTPEGAAEVFAARLGAAGEPAPAALSASGTVSEDAVRESGANRADAALAAEPGTLSHAALCVLREGLFEICRAERTVVDLDTPLAAVVGRPRAARWRRLPKEVACKLPPLEPSWASVLVLAAGLWAGKTLHGAVRLAFRLDDAFLTGASAAIVFLVAALAALELADFPGRVRDVRSVVHWMVATNPAPLRGGAAWTRAHVAEVTDAVWRLRWTSPGLRFFVQPAFLGGLGLLWVLVEAVLELVSLAGLLLA